MEQKSKVLYLKKKKICISSVLGLFFSFFDSKVVEALMHLSQSSCM